MRVPINPQTNVPTGKLGYGQNVDVSSGTRFLGRVVQKYAEEAKVDDRRKEMFDVHKRLIDETNALQQDFDTRKTAAPLGAKGFVEQINTDYGARHEALVQSLKDEGFSGEAVDEFATRLGGVRSQYVAQAMDFQDKSGYAKVVSDTDDLVTSLSQHVAVNPNSTGSAIDELRVALDSTPLDAVEKATVFEKGKSVLIKAGQENYAIQHPDVVLGLYGMPNELKTETNVATGELVNLGEAQKSVGGELASTQMPPQVIAGFLGNFHIEGGYTGAKGDGGKADGIAQWGADRQANFRALYNKNPSQATPAEQAKFVVWEMNNPEKAGMTVTQRDAILAAKTPGEAAELIDKYYERSDGTARGKRVAAANAFAATMSHAGATIEALTEGTSAAPAGMDTQGKTGIPILDLSTGSERIAMLNIARTIMNERESDAKAAKREAHETYINQFYNDLLDGKKGQADLNAAYNTGLITDYDERAKGQAILDSKNKKDDDLARFSIMLHSGQKFNPYDKDAQKAVDAGFDKAVEFTVKSGQNASPFVIALRAWQRTGILPTQGGVMIRGALVGTDPAQVAAAASVASNMITENPNAFAGVEGGEEIGKAAAMYKHDVDVLGMPAQDAANHVATMNSPEFQAKQKADAPERDAFIAKINGDKTHPKINVAEQLNKRLLPERGFGSFITARMFDPVRGAFANDTQRAEAEQTYLELALNHFDQYHNEGAALGYAGDQMARFYGIEGARMVKYPASKAYPAIQGSREYVLDQAAEDVEKYAKFKVPKEDIILQPTSSGSTADAFRAGKPAPYEILFMTHRDGHDIMHHIPGFTFVADVDKARQKAAEEARKVEKRNREVVVFPGIGEVR